MNRNRENRIYWNRGWTCCEEDTPALCEKETAGFPEGTEVELPHTAAVTPLPYFDESIYQKHCAYRKCFVPGKDWEGKRIFLNIEAAGHSARVYLNGILGRADGRDPSGNGKCPSDRGGQQGEPGSAALWKSY